jgi:hypothetical protein
MRGPERRQRSDFGAVGDRAAIGASILCIVHCLALPLVVALFPTLAQFADAPESAHLVLYLVAVPISGWAMVGGFRRHGLVLPMAWAAVGLGLMGVGALAGLTYLLETGITVAGSLALAFAHLINWRGRVTAGASDR